MLAISIQYILEFYVYIWIDYNNSIFYGVQRTKIWDIYIYGILLTIKTYIYNGLSMCIYIYI